MQKIFLVITMIYIQNHIMWLNLLFYIIIYNILKIPLPKYDLTNLAYKLISYL